MPDEYLFPERMSQFMFQVGGRYEHDFSGMAADAQEIFRINGIHDKFVKIQTDFLYRFNGKILPEIIIPCASLSGALLSVPEALMRGI